jgi:hypothetical protein
VNFIDICAKQQILNDCLELGCLSCTKLLLLINAMTVISYRLEFFLFGIVFYPANFPAMTELCLWGKSLNNKAALLSHDRSDSAVFFRTILKRFFIRILALSGCSSFFN